MSTNLFRRALCIASLPLAMLGGPALAQTGHGGGNSGGGDKVIYHIDNAAAQATKGLRNIRNHLDVAPDTKIVVITHAEGVDFLLEGAKDKNNPNIDYGPLVSALVARGVTFEVCEITLKNRHIDKGQFVLDAQFTPSGVVRIGRLQAREGYAYLKP